MTWKGHLLQFLLRGFSILPFAANRALGSLIGRLLLWIPNRTQQVARRNIALCFATMQEEEQEQMVQETMLGVGYGIAELGRFWQRPAQKTLDEIRQVHGEQAFRYAVADGKGVLLAVPHLGAWELLSVYLAHCGKTTVLYREPRDPGLDKVITDGRERSGAKLVRAGGAGVRELIRALRQGQIVGILPDQQPKRGQGVFAPFFGIQAFTMTLFSRLAMRSKVPVFTGYVERLPGTQGYELHFESVNEIATAADLDASVAQVNKAVERCARRIPVQYQWGYKRFSMRPDGERPLY